MRIVSDTSFVCEFFFVSFFSIPHVQPLVLFVSALTCPSGSTQVGGINTDISGCGLTSCSTRYSLTTIEQCRDQCFNNYQCNSFTWAPNGFGNPKKENRKK